MTGDGWGRAEIIAMALGIIDAYAGTPITIRQLYYRLVAQGMPNIQRIYKRVVAAMTVARWNGDVDMEAFVDRERVMEGRTASEVTYLDSEISMGRQQVESWMRAYHLNKWENQPTYVEVWVEKKALQGVLERPCQRMRVALGPCKGYPSLTFLNDAAGRFQEAHERGQGCLMLYFGDYDPSGVDIPRSLWDNIERMGVEIDVEVVALNPEQIERFNLPGVPAKTTDSRSAGWSGDVVELDAVEPKTLASMCLEAINSHFDDHLYENLKDREDREREQYQAALADHVRQIVEEM